MSTSVCVCVRLCLWRSCRFLPSPAAATVPDPTAEMNYRKRPSFPSETSITTATLHAINNSSSNIRGRRKRRHSPRQRSYYTTKRSSDATTTTTNRELGSVSHRRCCHWHHRWTSKSAVFVVFPHRSLSRLLSICRCVCL